MKPVAFIFGVIQFTIIIETGNIHVHQLLDTALFVDIRNGHQTQPFVGFTAKKVVTQYGIKSGDMINFHSLKYGEERDYDRRKGHYVCPITGVYFVSVSLWLHRHYSMGATAAVQRNMSDFMYLVHCTHTWRSYVVSNALLIECHKNDHLAVVMKNSGKWIIGEGRRYPSSFSAFLMSVTGTYFIAFYNM